MPNSMRVLFYEDPVTDQAAFLWRSPHIHKDSAWLLALREAGCDARMLVHDRFAQIALDCAVPEQALFTVAEDTLLDRLRDPQLDINTLFQRRFDALAAAETTAGDDPELALALETRDALADALRPCLADFTPDVIVTWAPAPHLRLLFPRALILHKETSVFSRAPFPLTYYLDPRGFHRWSAMAHAAEPARTTAPETLAALHRLRGGLASAFDALDNTVETAARLKANGRPVLLVAGHTNGVFFYDAACRFRSQAHALLEVLENVPADFTITTTEHPDCRKFTLAERDFFERRHANFVSAPGLSTLPGAGQNIIRHVDRVATVSSSVGLQALFWGKPLHALGASHLNRFAAAQGVRDPAAFEAQNAFDDGNAAWLAFHYSYPDKLAASPGWLAQVLRRKLDHWLAHGLAGYFDAPLAAPDALTDAMLQETAAALATHWGPAVGTPGRTTLDIDRIAYFGDGWSGAAPSQFGAYRWTTSETAQLRIPLSPGQDHEISIEVGTHAGCEGQGARLRLGDRVIAEAEVTTAGPSTLTATIPAADAAPITTLHLDSRLLDAPAPGGPRLGLITAKIKVVARRRPRAPQSAPRHSIVIPTLNGEEPLRTTLPYMLEVCGDDVEIIVSDNHSDDGTWAFLQSLDAPNLKLVRPPARLDYGRNAEFGYQHARGEWLSHFGDDDQTTISRFETIEAVADNSRAEMIIGSRLRYYWPSFPSEALANSIDPTSFGDTVLLADGPTIGRRMIHSANVRHTPAIVIKRDLVERVRREMSGVFMVQRLGEYVTYRVAAGLAREVACVNRPIAVIGRHTKSIGTSMHHDSNAGASYGTDPEREIGSSHGPAGFDFLGQQPFSLEATLIAAEVLAPHIGPIEIDYVVWRQRMLAELNSKVARGVIPQAVAAEIAARGEQALAGAIARQDGTRQPFGAPQALGPRWGWEASLRGEAAGFASINEVATWLENRHFAAQSLAALRYARLEDAQVEWIDG